jgi:hypothetical protein
LVIWSVDSDGPDFQAVLSGAIGDYGPAVTVLPDGKVGPEHTSEMELELRGPADTTGQISAFLTLPP